MDYKKIVLVGGGVLGAQIAFQVAYSGFDVTIWLRSEGSVERAKAKINNARESYLQAINSMDNLSDCEARQNWCPAIADFDKFNKDEGLEQVEIAYNNIKFELDLKSALENADLVIETMAEDKDAKINMYKQMAPLLDEKTVVFTNSSTMLPSKLAKYTGRPDKFLAFHFANTICRNNMTEIMPHSKTNKKYFDEAIEFAKAIRMIPIPIQKEKAGYLLNSMLVPLLFAAMDLYVNGVAEPKDIDEAWENGAGSPKGPFKILDTVGLTTAYNIVKMYVKVPSMFAPYNFKGMEKMLKKYIDEGKLGMSSGEGFYKYNADLELQ